MIQKRIEQFSSLSQYKLIVLAGLFVTLFLNFSFFGNNIDVYGMKGMNFVYMLSLYFVLLFLFVFLFSLVASKYTTKPLLIFMLIASAFSAYFMDVYHIIIDENMLRNVLKTDINETLDLVSLKLFLYILFFALLPSFMVYRIQVTYESGWKAILYKKIKYAFVSLAVIGILIVVSSDFYTSFIREHKPLRYYANPFCWIYSTGKYVHAMIKHDEQEGIQKIGEDVELNASAHLINSNKPELVIFVVGEATRADRFSLNGYKRETNPLLAQENVISFSHVTSCGTSTAHSVPCMFSILDRNNYSDAKAQHTENVLDVLTRVGVNVLWRDNNSDSKGVALRVEYETFKTPNINTKCDDECRDEGMLVDLDSYIQAREGEDILIVLHQMGNHGPAYYKRYPKEFEKFIPVCKTNQLEACSQEELSNAYDNAILHTDAFLAKTIEFLKGYDKTHEVAMLYMSDHGESLGEKGLYLHGMPYFIAPDEQIHVASVMWLGTSIQKELDEQKIIMKKDAIFSHDNIFHTLLSFFEVETAIFKKDKDILYDARKY